MTVADRLFSIHSSFSELAQKAGVSQRELHDWLALPPEAVERRRVEAALIAMEEAFYTGKRR